MNTEYINNENIQQIPPRNKPYLTFRNKLISMLLCCFGVILFLLYRLLTNSRQNNPKHLQKVNDLQHKITYLTQIIGEFEQQRAKREADMDRFSKIQIELHEKTVLQEDSMEKYIKLRHSHYDLVDEIKLLEKEKDSIQNNL